MTKLLTYEDACKTPNSYLITYAARCPVCGVYLKYHYKDIEDVTSRGLKGHKIVKHYVRCPSCNRYSETKEYIAKSDPRFDPGYIIF